MFKRSFSRGTSIVAALALVGLLSVALVFTQFLMPNTDSSSQSATAAETTVSKSADPTIPNCSTIQDGTKFVTKSEGDSKKQPCVCQIPATATTPRTFQSLKYTVTAKLLEGNPESITTVSKTGQPAAQNTKCIVQYGSQSSEVGSASLPAALTNANVSAQQDYTNAAAQCLANGQSGCITGPISESTKQGISDAFNTIKQNNSLTNPDGSTDQQYSDNQLNSAQKDLDNLSTCGQTYCPQGPVGCGADGNTDTCVSSGNPPVVVPGDPVSLEGGVNAENTKTDVHCEGSVCTANPTTTGEQEYLKSQGFSCTTTGDVYACTKPNDGTAPPKSGPQNTFIGPCPAGQTQGATGCVAVQAPSGGAPPGNNGGNGAGSGIGGALKSIAPALQSFLGGLMRGIGGAGAAATGPACPSDPSAYAAQQQQYQQQMQQYQYQMQQYQYQQQYGGGGYQVVSTNPVVVVPTNGGSSIAPPVAPVPCTPSSSTNTCAATPAQPTTACPAGTALRPITAQQSNGASCTTGWQCAASTAVTPTAQISCQPQVADVGMAISISFGCTNATGSQSGGFDSLGATSGSTSTVLAAPPAGVTTATYGITCINQNLSGQASCSVQVSRPSIVLVANPKVVATSTASTVGWVTSGMSSCVVSSPQQSDFTATNAGNTSVNGMATTSPITQDTDILLHCVTLGGGTRDATTTITSSAAGGGGGQTGAVTVSSSADGTNIARGAANTIQWSSTDVPSGSKLSLWLYDVQLNQVTALIKDELGTDSTYAWTLPTAGSTCDASSNLVCGTDLVPGREYGIEADLYTGDPANASYGAQGFTPGVFTISQ